MTKKVLENLNQEVVSLILLLNKLYQQTKQSNNQQTNQT